MVQNQGFTLMLLDEFKNPMRERVDKDGVTWCVGEPNKEFWIQMGQMHSWHASLLYLEVDGADIGYSMSFKKHWIGTTNPLGAIKSGQDWNSTDPLTTHAFKFMRHDVVKDDNDEDDIRGNTPAGSITMYVHKCVPGVKTELPQDGTTSAWTPSSSTGANVTHKKEQAALRAGVGSTPGSLNAVSNDAIDDLGEVCRITIRYTTDFGMAVRGLYTEEEVSAPPPPPPPKRVKREPRGDSEEDAICLE
jgi:hypothetical protein